MAGRQQSVAELLERTGAFKRPIRSTQRHVLAKFPFPIDARVRSPKRQNRLIPAVSRIFQDELHLEIAEKKPVGTSEKLGVEKRPPISVFSGKRRAEADAVPNQTGKRLSSRSVLAAKAIKITRQNRLIPAGSRFSQGELHLEIAGKNSVSTSENLGVEKRPSISVLSGKRRSEAEAAPNQTGKRLSSRSVLAAGASKIEGLGKKCRRLRVKTSVDDDESGSPGRSGALSSTFAKPLSASTPRTRMEKSPMQPPAPLSITSSSSTELETVSQETGLPRVSSDSQDISEIRLGRRGRAASTHVDVQSAATELVRELRKSLASGESVARLPVVEVRRRNGHSDILPQAIGERFQCPRRVGQSILDCARADLLRSGVLARRARGLYGRQMEYYLPEDEAACGGVARRYVGRGARRLSSVWKSTRKSLVSRRLASLQTARPQPSRDLAGVETSNPHEFERRLVLRHPMEVDDPPLLSPEQETACLKICAEVREALVAGTSVGRVPNMTVLQRRFRCGKKIARDVAHRTHELLSADFVPQMGPGGSVRYVLPPANPSLSRMSPQSPLPLCDVFTPSSSSAKRQKPPTTTTACAHCRGPIVLARHGISGDLSDVHIASVCCICLRAAITSLAQGQVRLDKVPAPRQLARCPSTESALAMCDAVDTVTAVPALLRLKRSLGGYVGVPCSESVRHKRVICSSAGGREIAAKKKWRCAALVSAVRAAATVRSESSGSALLGGACLPGWSARLVNFLGEEPALARPLACVNPGVLKQLLNDVSQLAAEVRPALRSLNEATVWGCCEERAFANAKAQASVISALSPLPAARLSTGAPTEFVREVEDIRVRRVDGLLASLASRAEDVTRALGLQRLWGTRD